jgi:hypothetical protein
MKQPEGYAMKGKKELVYKLKNSLYDLKQSPRMWYQNLILICWDLASQEAKRITVCILN